jgi:hypothetical protein
MLVPTLLSCYVLSSVIVDPEEEEEEGRADRAGEAGHVLDGRTASEQFVAACALLLHHGFSPPSARANASAMDSQSIDDRCYGGKGTALYFLVRRNKSCR